MNKYMKICIPMVFVMLVICTQTMASDPNDLIAIRDASDQALNAHDLDSMMSNWTDDVVYDYVPLPTPFVGKVAVRGFFEDLLVGFPDFGTTEGQILAADNIVFVEHSTTGTHLGEWMGIPPTGLPASAPHIDIYEFEGNKIKQATTYLDAASIMVQLGVMSAPDMPDLVPSVTLPTAEPTGLTPLAANAEAFSRWNSHDISLYAKMIHPDASIFIAAFGVPMDRNTYCAVTELYHQSFSDVSGEIVRSVDMGDGWVLSEVVFTGTQDNSYFGIPPTGRPIRIRAGVLHRFDENGLITNLSIYFDNLTVITQLTGEEWSLEGTWITVAPTPMGNTILKATYIAQDASKTKFTAQVEQMNMYPLFTDLYPDGERIKFAGGQINKTGFNSYEATLISYITKDSGLQMEEIVGIAVITGTLTLVGPDSATGQGSGAYYLAGQDADNDGLPDEGQEPAICLPWAYNKKRLKMMTPCVPASLP